MQVGIVAKRGSEPAAALASDLRAALADESCSVLVDAGAAEAVGVEGVPTDALVACDLVVSVGGDGTFLHAARHVGSTPILGVNLGEVGFLNPVPPDAAIDRVRDAVGEIEETGAPRSREVLRLAARGDGWSVPPALNEVLVTGTARGRGGGLDLAVAVDGADYAATHADGVLVSTQTGSTAYNLSEGGPLVHPQVAGLVVTELCPEERMPPLVVPPTARVTVRATGASVAVVASDGGNRERVDLPGTVTIERAAEPARIVGPRSDFFQALGKLD